MNRLTVGPFDNGYRGESGERSRILHEMSRACKTLVHPFRNNEVTLIKVQFL